ncbi:MAG TPA: HAD family phosphatase [Methylotenera sp.]|nr:HAD family phosphatase [Methylotenera sp.]
MFKAAIFDMDGLLIDSERIIMQACILAASELGISYTQSDYAQLIGRSAPDSTQVMTMQLGGVNNFTKVMKRVDEILAVSGNYFPLKIGALEIVKHFHAQGIPCGVASSSYQDIIRYRLSEVGILEYFSVITSGDEVERGKPHPDIYLLAIKKLGVPAEACIAFEDSEFGAHAAITAGLKVVVVPDLKQPSDYVNENCYQVLNSLSDASSILKHSLIC